MNFGSSGPVEILFALVRVMLAVYLRNISSHRLGVVGWFFFFFLPSFFVVLCIQAAEMATFN